MTELDNDERVVTHRWSILVLPAEEGSTPSVVVNGDTVLSDDGE